MLHNTSNYNRGKQLRIAGHPIPDLPERNRHSQEQCDIRSGWLVADVNIAQHPDWTSAQILSTHKF